MVMLKEAVRICDPIEPFDSILYDKDIDSLLTCTYSKNTQERSGQIRILDKLTLNDVFSLRLSSAAFHLDYQQHANLYVTGLGDGQITLFNAKTRQLQVDHPKPFAGQMISDAKLSKDLRQVVFSDKSSALRVYERENSTIVFDQPKAHVLYGKSVDAWCCSFLDNTNLVASGGDDNLLKIWDMREHENRPVQTNKSHSGGVVRIRITSNGQLCTGSYDEHLRFFDLRTINKPVSSIKFDGGVWDFEFDEEHHKILIANMYNGLAIVDSKSLEIIYAHQMPDELIYGVTATSTPSSIYCCSFTSGSAWRFDIVEHCC